LSIQHSVGVPIYNYTAILEFLSNKIEEQSVKDVVKAIGIKYFYYPVFTIYYENNKNNKCFQIYQSKSLDNIMCIYIIIWVQYLFLLILNYSFNFRYF